MSRRGDLFTAQMIQQLAPLIIARRELRLGGMVYRHGYIPHRPGLPTVHDVNGGELPLVEVEIKHAAHLAGVVASATTLPVIGVPIATNMMGGMDSLLSTVQMPSGIPVATVAVGGAKNAGILAAQILSVKDESMRETLKAYRKKMAEGVLAKDRKLSSMSVAEYLEQKK